ncbi:hypothetical protein CMQ_5838 [Grosmannia clavigera kw1407]|uniref:Conidiation-specific protein n=1 Tax=Grosmannia clavigera (strain kw1407 / UAMH 11150) TaxID=655863 RepID=F0XIL6_GROCL|nr:uncharacterized protein CMQ_5838 [Grosmannia clavigera kw1407]EFX02477.1 hypothetical protein CMQ_5838 [Grosmannia clavigera kw1407]
MSSSATPTPREQRSDSTTSATSAASSTGRRPSTGMFSSLQQLKDDPTNLARRKSMHDQRPVPGMIGRWWNNYVYGINSPNNPPNK